MQGSIGWWFVLGVIEGLAGAPAARAKDVASMLKGQWVAEGGDCTKPYTLELSGDVLRLTDAAGHADVERVFARRKTGFATRVARSTSGIRIGQRNVYELLAPGQISVTEAASGRSGIIVRCPDPLPANIAPEQLVETIYARYATPDALGTPFESEATVRQFLAPELADHFMRWMTVTGHLPDGCVGNYDPFVPGFKDGLSADDDMKRFDEVRAEKVRVTAPPVLPGATQATIHVSVGDLGEPGEISVVLDWTPAGWRISDVIPASGLSFRADMLACSTPWPRPAAAQSRLQARSHVTH